MASKNILIAGGVLCLALAAGAYGFIAVSSAARDNAKRAAETSDASGDVAGVSSPGALETAAGETEKPETESTPNSSGDQSGTPEAVAPVAAQPSPEAQPESVSTVAIDVAAALAPRTLGSESAPVAIEEFASLSCSHCAHFSKEVFDKIREAYIDTGKVKFTYTDFPLNAPAMDAAMLARCLPEDRYFKFVKFLFETQNDWAFGADYKQKLEQNAKLSGAGEGLVKACLENESLKQGLVEKMQKASSAHDVQSTPSFVIDGKELYKGAHSFEDFSKLIDQKLEERKAAE